MADLDGEECQGDAAVSTNTSSNDNAQPAGQDRPQTQPPHRRPSIDSAALSFEADTLGIESLDLSAPAPPPPPPRMFLPNHDEREQEQQTRPDDASGHRRTGSAPPAPSAGGGDGADGADGGGTFGSSWAENNAADRPPWFEGTVAATEATGDAHPRQQQQQMQQQHSQSLPEMLGSAVGPPVLSLLRVLAAFGLSTTGKVIAPPLNATRYVLLPALFHALGDMFHRNAPSRLKDWLQIVQSGLAHLWSVVIQTPRGGRFRGQVAKVGGDLVDAAATAKSRQAMVDAMAAGVKAAEALHTPEFRALLDHCAVLGCRIVDAASTPAAKMLMHDVGDTVWDAVELLADDSTVVAMAEVTAYLIHALEMENVVHRDPVLGGAAESTGGDDASKSRQRRAQAARRRRERNRYNARTYVDCDTLDGGTIDNDDLYMDGDGATGGIGIEEAILSSLGDGTHLPLINGTRRERDDVVGAVDDGAHRTDGAASLPSRVFLSGGKEVDGRPAGGEEGNRGEHDGDDHASSIATEQTGNAVGTAEGGANTVGVSNDEQQQPQPAAAPFADEACDVEFLREQIAQRSRTLQREQAKARRRSEAASTSTSGEAGTAMRNGPLGTTVIPQSKRDDEKPLVDIEELSNTGLDNADPKKTERAHPHPRAAGSGGKTSPAVSQFQRVLEHVSEEKQREAITNILGTTAVQRGSDAAATAANTTDAAAPARGRAWYPRAAAAAGAGNERGQDTIRSRLAAAYASRASKERAGIGVGMDGGASSAPGEPHSVGGRAARTAGKELTRAKLFIGLVLFWFVLGCVVMTGFGCYGMYVFFFTGSRPRVSLPRISLIHPPHQPPQPSEIVVRIVREVVHVTPDGKRMSRGATLEEITEDLSGGVDAVEEMVAQAAVNAVKHAAGAQSGAAAAPAT